MTGITDPGSAVPNTIFSYDAHDNRTSVTDSGAVEPWRPSSSTMILAVGRVVTAWTAAGPFIRITLNQ
nr:hypothetical protein [Candidatus Electrothrix aestuarii]